MSVLEQIIQRTVSKSLSTTNVNVFDIFLQECQDWYDRPAASIAEIKEKTTKEKGDIWEDFCKLYLVKIKGYSEAWALREVPDDLLTSMSLKRKDMGIDLIARDKWGYHAVQCKYKRNNPRKRIQCVGWKTLSTFYSLCQRTGPWVKMIVMTNCNSVRHAGKKTSQDLSICLKTFQNLTTEDWYKLSGNTGNVLGSKSDETVDVKEGVNSKEEKCLRLEVLPDQAELRAMRLKRFG